MTTTLNWNLYLAEPRMARDLGSDHWDAVGLLRLDTIMREEAKVHPMAALQPERLATENRRAVDALAATHASPVDYFLDVLSHRLTRVCAIFAPRPVVVRFSDLTSDQYAELIGGEQFEPTEKEPSLGLRGAARYIDELYRPAFALECEAIRRARESGGTNLRAMIPVCRTIEEADAVVDLLSEWGMMASGDADLLLHCMIEVPSNLLTIEELGARFDGLAIGPGDLAMFFLARRTIDYDNIAVRRAVAFAIAAARRSQVPIDFCVPNLGAAALASHAVSEGATGVTVRAEDRPQLVRILTPRHGRPAGTLYGPELY